MTMWVIVDYEEDRSIVGGGTDLSVVQRKLYDLAVTRYEEGRHRRFREWLASDKRLYPFEFREFDPEREGYHIEQVATI